MRRTQVRTQMKKRQFRMTAVQQTKHFRRVGFGIADQQKRVQTGKFFIREIRNAFIGLLPRNIYGVHPFQLPEQCAVILIQFGIFCEMNPVDIDWSG